jgi:hypothetical protein
MDVFSEENKWVIALYEKEGRAYSEIGIFFEGPANTMEAFDMFSDMCSPLPTWQAVERAIELRKAGVEDTREYEIRLINNTTHRVMATLLWSKDVVEQFIDSVPPKKTYIITAEVDLFEDEGIDPDDWDWEDMDITQRIRVLSVSPEYDKIETDQSKGEAREEV